jgi:hypothetical protein
LSGQGKPVTTSEAQDHHGSHEGLLCSGDDAAPRTIDAVIVPTTRRPGYLRYAAELANALGCTLVTLHSKQWTSAERAVQRLPWARDLIAIDVTNQAGLRFPSWQTGKYVQSKIFPRLPNYPRTDLSAKRNLGLMLAHLLGWSRIMFLDDDITELNPDEVRQASGLLGTHSAVGLHVCGFHDHSVVCHAYRDAGGRQQAFIGGGALVVELDRCRSFFPEIYNDDWFFLLDGDKRLQSVAVTGRVVQYPYDPFRPDRARAEEFGDVLAEGIYWLLDQNLSIADADHAHWSAYLELRRQFIERVRTMVLQDPELDLVEKARRVDALGGSLGRLRLVSAELCVSYLRAWQADQQSWRRHIDALPTGVDRMTALGMLARPDSSALNWRMLRGSRVVLPADGQGTLPHLPQYAPEHEEPGRVQQRELATAGAANGDLTSRAAL